MKKIIALSATICLLISVMAGFGAFAAETKYYDIDFDSWDINVAATDENALIDLNNALGNVTGTTDGLWIATAFSGDAKVSTVTWEGKGKVLKLEGTPHNLTTDATLKIEVPYSSYKAATYDNDELVVEYDIYIQGDNLNLSDNAAQFYYTVFGEGGYNEIAHIKKTEKIRPYTRGITKAIKDDAGSDVIDTHAQTVMYDDYMGIKTWYRLKWVIDEHSGIPYTFEGTEFPSFEKTATLYITNLSTEETVSNTVHVPVNQRTKYWEGSALLLGGALRTSANAMEGIYYVDNFKLYRQNKFAFESSADKDATNVAFNKKSVSFTMNAPVSAASLAGITLKAGANTVSTTAALSESDNKTVVVTIGEELSYSTSYTLDFSSVKREDGEAIELGETTITFTTQAPPALYVTETKIYSGSDSYVANETTISADGGLYTFAAQVKSTVETSKPATAIVAVYDATGKLVSASYVSKNIPALSEETIAAGSLIPASLAGGTVKMFLWNNVNMMQPYIKPLAEDIN